MAQGAIASVPTNGTTTLTAEELHEILECEKIVRFRDAVLSGSHPKIKVHSHINGKFNATGHVSPNSLLPRPKPSPSQVESNTKAHAHVIDDNTVSNNTSPSTQRIATGQSAASYMPVKAMAVKSGINPILLEKSDDLIKAEIQLQRQRLERALREQIEQRRLTMKDTLQTSESLPDFDLSEVFSRALTVVHPFTASKVEQTVGDIASASDSFDENTFYSSQHDTPEHSSSSRDQRDLGETLKQNVSLPTIDHADHGETQDEVMTGMSLSNNVISEVQEPLNKPSPVLQQSIQRAIDYPIQPGFNISSTDAMSRNQIEVDCEMDTTETTRGKAEQAPIITVSTQFGYMTGTSNETPRPLADLVAVQTGASLKQKFGENIANTFVGSPEPAIIRTRDDVPALAPQPARVSPLATARAPPVIDQSIITGETPTTQVISPRKTSAASSPDSSPKGDKVTDKKKVKKKKPRKTSGKQTAVDTPDSTYIKPEPQSPSPFAALPLPRPLPRHRQTFQQGPELNYDEPRYDVSREQAEERVPHLRSKGRGPRHTNNQPEDNGLYEPREAEIPSYRQIGRDEKQYRRVVSQDVYGAPRSPGLQPLPYALNERRTMRATSHTGAGRYVQEVPRYYRDLPPRASARPDAERERSRSPVMHERRPSILMAPPPRLAPNRIVVDEYGQQYYAPPAIPMSTRHSVAPAIRPIDDDIIYERTALRPVRRPVADFYEQDGVIFRRPSPPLPPPLRVLSQSGQELDYRSYRQRDYSPRPVADVSPADEYVRIREPLDRRQMSHFEEAPRDHVARLGSVRPENTKYCLSREHIARVQSVRPEAPPQDYSRPEPRREVAPRSLREFSVRPSELEIVRREFSVRPGEPEIVRREYRPAQDAVYASARPMPRRVLAEPEYIGTNRDITQDVYADDLSRDVVYR